MVERVIEVDLSSIPLVVLAGGRASRLGVVGDVCPKYLQPIRKGKCFADFHMEWIAKQGFRKIFFSIGYLGSQIQNYLSKYENDFELHFIEDGSIPLGTGGALKKVASDIEEECLALTYGDTILSLSCSKMWDSFLSSGLDCSMSIFKNSLPGHQANVSRSANSVLYDKRNPPKDATYIDYGFLFLKKSLVESFPEEVPLDIATPLCELSKASRLGSYEVSERFWEIGSPEALEAFRVRFNL